MRPGRLDVLLYVGVAEDSQSKLKVLRALTRKFRLADDIDLPIVADKCPPTFTGADMYALSSDAWMTALKRTVAQVSNHQCPSFAHLLLCPILFLVPACHSVATQFSAQIAVDFHSCDLGLLQLSAAVAAAAIC